MTHKLLGKCTATLKLAYSIYKFKHIRTINPEISVLC